MKLTADFDKYKDALEKICKESVSHFMSAEGRAPLSAFADISREVPGLPENCPVTCYAFVYDEEAVGYAWVMEEIPDNLYYILHFVISEKYRRRGLGGTALRELDRIYGEKYAYSELLVSAGNFQGLSFWVKNGYTEITCVFPPEEQGTLSVELNLRKRIKK